MCLHCSILANSRNSQLENESTCTERKAGKTNPCSLGIYIVYPYLLLVGSGWLLADLVRLQLASAPSSLSTMAYRHPEVLQEEESLGLRYCSCTETRNHSASLDDDVRRFLALESYTWLSCRLSGKMSPWQIVGRLWWERGKRRNATDAAPLQLIQNLG